MFRDILQDLRYGARTLHRNPGFSAMVVLSLALGIGANASIFTLGNALFLRRLPVPYPAGLVLLSNPQSSGDIDGLPRGRLELFPTRLYQRLRTQDQGRLFQGVAAQNSSPTSAFVEGRAATAPGGSDDRATGRSVSSNFFDVLGVRAFRGRTFLPEDERGPAAEPVLVLSHGYWQRRFGGDPTLIGTRLTVDRLPHTVVGIMPPGFTGLNVGMQTDFWVSVRPASRPWRLWAAGG